MSKPVRRLLWTGVFVALTGILAAIARFFPAFWFSFYTDLSRSAMGVLGRITGIFPFCLWQVLLILAVLGALAGLVWCLRDHRFWDWLTGLLEGLSLFALLFVALWGLNHFAPQIGEQIGLKVTEYTVSQLKEAAAYYAVRASEASLLVDRNEAGDVEFPGFSDMAAEAAACYDALAQDQPRFAGGPRRVKPLLGSPAFGYMGITGVFFAATGEPGVSTETYVISQPFTMCHELGHGLAFAAEEEANYCGFLACMASGDPAFRYSGWYNAYIYCSNALYEIDPDAARDLWRLCSPELIHDCNVHIEFNQQYEGAVQEAAQAVNDAYLKAFQEEGTRSYGLVTDYLIAHYLSREE